MISPILAAFKRAKKSVAIDSKKLLAFNNRLAKNKTYLKSDGVMDHFCVGVIITNMNEGKMYVGHHIKTNSWMGAGGHIEANESPMQAALRECEEEIGLKVNKATLLGLTHFDDLNTEHCREHFDFFYKVSLDSTPDFKFDRKEFYEAGWYTFEEVFKKKLLPKYRDELLTLFNS